MAVRGREPGKGQHDLVGGFLEYGEDPKVAAFREFKEETGIEIDLNELKFIGMWVDSYNYQDNNQLVLNIVYLIELSEKFSGKPADDVADLIWMPLTSEPKFAFSYLHKVWKNLRR